MFSIYWLPTFGMFNVIKKAFFYYYYLDFSAFGAASDWYSCIGLLDINGITDDTAFFRNLLHCLCTCF